MPDKNTVPDGPLNKDYMGVWRHKATGGFYVLLLMAMNETDLIPAAVYKSLKDNIIWTRPWREFTDGRFEKVDWDAVNSSVYHFIK